jgi:hypothetical protein
MTPADVLLWTLVIGGTAAAAIVAVLALALIDFRRSVSRIAALRRELEGGGAARERM